MQKYYKKKLEIYSMRAVSYVIEINQRPKDIKYVSTVRPSTNLTMKGMH